MFNLYYYILPYCVQKQKGGVYVVLNRRYKPLGFTTDERLDYEAYPITLPLKITAKQAARISFNESTDTDVIFLYDGGCTPWTSAENWKAYQARLKALSELKPREQRSRL